MTKTILGALALAAASMTASAATVSYSTAVTWNCNGIVGCTAVGNDLTINDLIIRYTPNSANVNAPSAPGFTGANFGGLIAVCASGGNCSTLTDIAGAQITVEISQTIPFVATTSFSGVLGGQISDTQSLNPALVTFSPLTTSVTDSATAIVNYFLQQPSNPVNGYILNSIADNSPTSIQGALNIESVPEPSTVALIGLGLAAICFRRRNA